MMPTESLRVVCRSALLMAAVVASGCAGPRVLDREAVREAGLVDIQNAAQAAIDQVRADPDVTWRTGWVGTATRSGDAVRGSCTDWQALMYRAVQPVVASERSPWSLWFVGVNRGTRLEHNAVVVYRTAWLREDRSLAAAGINDPVFVLDAWHRGEADLHHISKWIDTWSITDGTADLYDPAEEMRLRGGDAPTTQPAD